MLKMQYVYLKINDIPLIVLFLQLNCKKNVTWYNDGR